MIVMHCGKETLYRKLIELGRLSGANTCNAQSIEDVKLSKSAKEKIRNDESFMYNSDTGKLLMVK